MVSNKFIITTDESWREEIRKYSTRIESVINLDVNLIDTLKEYWPSYWRDSKPSRESSVAIKLAVFSISIFSNAIRVVSSVRDQWLTGLFIIVPLNTRFVFETWGAVHYAKNVLITLIEKNDIEKADKLTNRLTFGARSEVLLPFGGKVDEKSLNVMEFIRELKDVRDNAEALYDFLSEASHPNMIQTTYFQMAGPPLSNWGNDRFKEHAHQLLDKTLTALEVAVSGLQVDVLEIIEKSVRYIEKHENNKT